MILRHNVYVSMPTRKSSMETKTLAESLRDEREAVHRNSDTLDAKEGIMAFLEKRKPQFNKI